MNFKRLGRGDVVAAAGGLLLFISLFLPWFGVRSTENICGRSSCTAFQTFNVLDILLVAGAAAPWILVWIVVRGHELSWPPGEVTAISGLTAAALIFYNGVIDQVGDNRAFVDNKTGWYLGLVGALGIVVGGGISQIRRGGVPRRPPGSF